MYIKVLSLIMIRLTYPNPLFFSSLKNAGMPEIADRPLTPPHISFCLLQHSAGISEKVENRQIFVEA